MSSTCDRKQIFFGLDFVFFVYYVTMRTCLGIFGAFACPWAPAQYKFFFTQNFLDLWLEHESLEPLIDLLAHWETKLWLKNLVFGKNLKFSKKVTLATCGWQPDWARELFKPKTHEVFYIRFKKNFQDFFGLWSHEWRMFCEYSYDVICGSNLRIMWLKVLLDPGVEYEFLEPLIDFLAFLIPKLGQKEPNPLLIISGDFHN